MSEGECPLCGQRVEISSSEEGTSFFVGVDAREVAHLRAIMETAADALARLREEMDGDL